MKCFSIALVAVVSILSACSLSFAYDAWEIVRGIKDASIEEVIASPYEEGIVYAASSKNLYRTENNGTTWDVVFSTKGDGSRINFVMVEEKSVFVCTENGVFKSNDGISNWKRIFKGVGDEENNALHIARSKDNLLYIGTEKGLFVSNDKKRTWIKDYEGIGNTSVRWIAFLRNEIFIASLKGVYKSSASGWKRVFITSTEEIVYDSDSTDTASITGKPVNSVLVNKNRVFLATDEGIFFSNNKGANWQRFQSNGLMSLKVKRLMYGENLFAATDNGLFIFNDNTQKWNALYKGMSSDETRSLSKDKGGIIWVATGNGLYKSTLKSDSLLAKVLGFPKKDEENILNIFDHEPSIAEVQNKAIQYAEVHPEKIQTWRKQAKIKNLLPELSVDYDKTVNYDSGADRYYVGPYDWGLSLKWDLGDLIWNPSQTSIDVRSKLMVQLRDDIMNEITRTYFERRRLQIETYLSPPRDIKQILEKDLRIQELTADLDALTGGYFSAQFE